MTDETPPPVEPRFSDGDGIENGWGTAAFPYSFVRIPDLGRKIRGSTHWFFIDLEEGELHAVTIDSTGKIENKNVTECFGKRWKAPVVKLVPKGEADGQD